MSLSEFLQVAPSLSLQQNLWVGSDILLHTHGHVQCRKSFGMSLQYRLRLWAGPKICIVSVHCAWGSNKEGVKTKEKTCLCTLPVRVEIY